MLHEILKSVGHLSRRAGQANFCTHIGGGDLEGEWRSWCLGGRTDQIFFLRILYLEYVL